MGEAEKRQGSKKENKARMRKLEKARLGKDKCEEKNEETEGKKVKMNENKRRKTEIKLERIQERNRRINKEIKQNK